VGVVISQRRAAHLTYIARCEDARAELAARLDEHLRINEFLAELQAIFTGSGGTRSAAEFRRDLVLKAMLNSHRPTGEVGEFAAVVRAALPKLEEVDGSREGGPVEAAKKILNWSQDSDNKISSQQKRYLIILQGPYLYGLALMIVAGLFPVVGMFAILPGRWRALVHWGKAFLSIKLWPVCWAILTKFEKQAERVDAWQEVTTADLATVIASMYVVTPVLCFAIVALATSVSALPFHQAASAPAGIGPAVMVARAGGRIMRG
jgi:hypothetical protein